MSRFAITLLVLSGCGSSADLRAPPRDAALSCTGCGCDDAGCAVDAATAPEQVTFGRASFVVRSQIYYRVRESHGGVLFDRLGLVLSDVEDACGLVTRGCVGDWTPARPRGELRIVLMAPTLEAGSFPVTEFPVADCRGSDTQAAQLGSSIFEGERVTPLVQSASSGIVAVSRLDADEIVGSYRVVVENGAISEGTFTARACPALHTRALECANIRVCDYGCGVPAVQEPFARECIP